jgi:hypothetical protein
MQRRRILFVPVTTAHGSGELLRCLIVARELHRADPDVDIHFVINREAHFRDSIEFGVHHCDASPTYCTPRVIEVLEQVRPDVVVFDNAGRTRQIRAAHRLGARIVFVSRTPRLRRKAFRISWMLRLSEHWIVSPAFVTGGLGLRERLLGRLFPGVTIRFLDALYQPSAPEARARFLESLEIGVRPFTEAARSMSAHTGATALVLTGSSALTAPEHRDGVVLLPRLHSDEVQHLIHGAELVVSNGGSSLMHALTQGKATVCVGLRSDQGRRIRAAARTGAAVSEIGAPERITKTATDLWQDTAARQQLVTRLAQLGLTNGLPITVRALRDLLAAGR